MDEGHFTESIPNGRPIHYGNQMKAPPHKHAAKDTPDASDRLTLKVRFLPAKRLAQRML